MLAARVESEDMIDDEELGRQAYALIGELILETAEAEMGKMARAMKRRRHAKTVSRWVEVHRHRVDWTTRQILNETVRGIVRSVALEAQTELSWREDRARENDHGTGAWSWLSARSSKTSFGRLWRRT